MVTRSRLLRHGCYLAFLGKTQWHGVYGNVVELRCFLYQHLAYALQCQWIESPSCTDAWCYADVVVPRTIAVSAASASDAKLFWPDGI